MWKRQLSEENVKVNLGEKYGNIREDKRKFLPRAFDISISSLPAISTHKNQRKLSYL